LHLGRTQQKNNQMRAVDRVAKIHACSSSGKSNGSSCSCQQ